MYECRQTTQRQSVKSDANLAGTSTQYMKKSRKYGHPGERRLALQSQGACSSRIAHRTDATHRPWCLADPSPSFLLWSAFDIDQAIG
jgi:hypothetical protein